MTKFQKKASHIWLAEARKNGGNLRLEMPLQGWAFILIERMIEGGTLERDETAPCDNAHHFRIPAAR